jgi:6-phosphogluconolactonase (cycloisomerase 2 family)
MTRRLAFAAIALVAPLAGTAVGQSATDAIFVVNNVSDEISAFRFLPGGVAEFVGNYAVSDGPLSIAISPDGTRLAVGHGTVSDTVEVLTFFEVNADASLTLIGTALTPDSPLGVCWINNDVVGVTETDVGGANFVHAYFVDEGGGIVEIDIESTGAFNTSLIRSPDDQFLFANDSLGSNMLHVFRIQPDGTLDPSDDQSTGAVYPLDPAISHDGTKLYVGGGISSGGDKIGGWAFDGEEGLQLLPGSPYVSPGESPAYMAVSRDNAFVFAGHGTDATVRSFEIGPDGALTSTGFAFDIGLQGTIGDVQTLRNFLLVTDESTAIDGIKGLYVFEIAPDGSFAQVGPVYDVGGVRPEAIATWTAGPAGDLDGDGDVDLSDLGILLASYGIDDGGDLDGDGDTDLADLGILLANYGFGT